MPMTTEHRKETARRMVHEMFVALNETATLSSDDLRSAVDAVDDWIDEVAASYLAVLPQPFKGSSTVAHKALLLAFVTMKRGGVF